MLVNIVYFEHRVAGVQGIGIALVFGAVMLEVWQNYKEKTMGFKAVEAVEEVREEHIDKEPPVL